MRNNRLPHHPLSWLFRRAWLPSNTENSLDLIIHRIAITTEQDHRWCPMTGNASPRSVNHLGQVQEWEERLDQLIPKLALDERIGRNHADVTSPTAILWSYGQVEKPLNKRHG